MVPRNALVGEHTHAAPLGLVASAELVHPSVEQLSGFGRAQGHGHSSLGQRCRRAAEHSARTEGSNDFVVAHVDDEGIGLEFRALLSDAADGMRIDAGHGHVDYFDVSAGECFAQHDFQHSRKTEARRGESHGRRFAENKNAERPRGFRIGQTHGDTFAYKKLGKKKTSEVPVGVQITILAAQEKSGRKACSCEVQRNFEDQKKSCSDPRRHQHGIDRPFFHGRDVARAMAATTASTLMCSRQSERGQSDDLSL